MLRAVEVFHVSGEGQKFGVGVAWADGEPGVAGGAAEECGFGFLTVGLRERGWLFFVCDVTEGDGGFDVSSGVGVPCGECRLDEK